MGASCGKRRKEEETMVEKEEEEDVLEKEEEEAMAEKEEEEEVLEKEAEEAASEEQSEELPLTPSGLTPGSPVPSWGRSMQRNRLNGRTTSNELGRFGDFPGEPIA